MDSKDIVNIEKKNIAYYGSERKDILSVFPDGVESVLDVGCGSGFLGRALKEKKGVRKVTGIEPVEEAASSAKNNIDEVYVAGVEDECPALKEGAFDAVIFADVLEHLVDPWSALRKFRRFLKEDGYLIVSVPNIRYHGVLGRIVFNGEFRYEEHGILDAGHLRFFTYKMMKQYLEEAGFRLERTKRNFSGHVSWLLNKVFLDIFADFFTRQYIMIARPVNKGEHGTR